MDTFFIVSVIIFGKGAQDNMEYRKKKRSYMFTNKTHPVEAILAVILGIVIFVTICVLSFYSSQSGGNGPIFLGIVSFWVMLLALAAFVVSLLSMRKKDVFHLFPVLGSVINGVLFLGLFLLYMVGFSV